MFSPPSSTLRNSGTMSVRIVVWLVAALSVVAVTGRVALSNGQSENNIVDYQLDLSSDESENYTSDYLGTLSRRSRRGAINTDILRQHLKQVKLSSFVY